MSIPGFTQSINHALAGYNSGQHLTLKERKEALIHSLRREDEVALQEALQDEKLQTSLKDDWLMAQDVVTELSIKNSASLTRFFLKLLPDIFTAGHAYQVISHLISRDANLVLSALQEHCGQPGPLQDPEWQDLNELLNKLPLERGFFSSQSQHFPLKCFRDQCALFYQASQANHPASAPKRILWLNICQEPSVALLEQAFQHCLQSSKPRAYLTLLKDSWENSLKNSTPLAIRNLAILAKWISQNKVFREYVDKQGKPLPAWELLSLHLDMCKNPPSQEKPVNFLASSLLSPLAWSEWTKQPARLPIFWAWRNPPPRSLQLLEALFPEVKEEFRQLHAEVPFLHLLRMSQKGEGPQNTVKESLSDFLAALEGRESPASISWPQERPLHYMVPSALQAGLDRHKPSENAMVFNLAWHFCLQMHHQTGFEEMQELFTFFAPVFTPDSFKNFCQQYIHPGPNKDYQHSQFFRSGLLKSQAIIEARYLKASLSPSLKATMPLKL